MKPSEQSIAAAVVRKMLSLDAFSQSLGIEILEVRPGYARIRARISAQMSNGHTTCHGGALFSIADSAFGFACNTHNLRTVAAGCSIEYLMPVHEGDVITAEAVEAALHGRAGVYDIKLTNQHGATVATFRGRSHRLNGEMITADEFEKWIGESHE
jgi:acyl-CoA thioesterase